MKNKFIFFEKLVKSQENNKKTKQKNDKSSNLQSIDDLSFFFVSSKLLNSIKSFIDKRVL